MKGFNNVAVYIRGEGIVKRDIGIENGRIAFIGKSDIPFEPVAEGFEGLLTAGFIDEHIHGALGFDTMDGTGEALEKMSEALAKEGTTAFLATTMTCPVPDICRAARCAKEAEAKGARLLGVHLEGPFISERHIGAQNPEYVLKYDKKAVAELCAENNIKMVTLAPEAEGAEELIADFKSRGVRVSAGHSDASFACVEKASRGGLDCITHTFNAMSPLHHREAGLVGGALLLDSLWCELIADGLHVSVPAMKLLIKNKPKDKLILITDAMRGKGMPDGEYDLGSQAVYVKDGSARLSDGTLAGSTLKMNIAVKNAVTLCGADICTALDFASYNPAKHLGIDGECGSIETGKRADFTALDKDFNVLFTVVGGEVVYKR